MESSSIVDMKGFELGAPALVCRWRLAHGHLPLENRHLRALAARRVNEAPVSAQLVAWVKQHVEWTLTEGSRDYPNGVLALIVDEQGRAAMAVGPYEPLPDTSLQGLVRRAERAADEAERMGVAPETLWVAQGETLLWERGEACAASGAASLVGQLAQTVGITTVERRGLREDVADDQLRIDEAFLVSDEHGVVMADDCGGRYGRRMEEAYRLLIERS
jgi:hypothetical protein